MFGGDNNDNGAPAQDGNQPMDASAMGSDNTPAAAPMYDAPTPPPAPHDGGGSAAPAASDDVLPNDHAGADELLNLKQQALQQLSPLVSHLDQSPEEKFRTTMMMIQASDNSELLKEAYEAAQAIPDDKTKAQALLDVINEINYFTQQHDQQ